jgi:hypothetical protein
VMQKTLDKYITNYNIDIPFSINCKRMLCQNKSLIQGEAKDGEQDIEIINSC